MKTIPDNKAASMELGFKNSLKNLFLTFDEDFFKISNQGLYLPVDEAGRIAKLAGDRVIQAPAIFNTYIENLDPAIMGTAELLDAVNAEKLLSTDYFWKLQEKTVRYRQWKITSNRVTATIKSRIKWAVDGVLQEGGSVEDLQKSLIEVFQKYNKGQAFNTATIARTEMYSAIRNTEYNYMQEFSKQKKVKMDKDWVTAGDERVRALHKNWYGKQGFIDMDSYFKGIYRKKDSVIATKVKRPHDPRGQAFDVINCRCKLKFKAI